MNVLIIRSFKVHCTPHGLVNGAPTMDRVGAMTDGSIVGAPFTSPWGDWGSQQISVVAHFTLTRLPKQAKILVVSTQNALL
jgi:hypothetical protein